VAPLVPTMRWGRQTLCRGSNRSQKRTVLTARRQIREGRCRLQRGDSSMASSNRGVVYVKQGKVEVRSIDFLS